MCSRMCGRELQALRWVGTVEIEVISHHNILQMKIFEK